MGDDPFATALEALKAFADLVALGHVPLHFAQIQKDPLNLGVLGGMVKDHQKFLHRNPFVGLKIHPIKIGQGVFAATFNQGLIQLQVKNGP